MDLTGRTLVLSAASDDGDLLRVRAGGVDVFSVDSDGAVTVAGALETGGTLTAYTPDTDIVVGTGGSITGKYQVVGDMMDLFVKVDLGTSFDVSDTTISLPDGWQLANDTHLSAWYTDSGVPGPLIAFAAADATGLDLYTTAGAAVGATAPITWTAADNIYLSGRFQVAAA